MGQGAVLYVIGGADRGKTYELVLPETRIGRGADQDMVLADIAVSRRHVTVHAEGGRYRLRDLGSGNGTLVNGARVDTVLLNDGDQIEVGNTLMRFDHALSRAAAPSQQPMPPPYASPSAAPAYSAPVAHSYPTAMPAPPVDTPSESVARPPMMMPLSSGSVSLPVALAAPLASPRNRMIAFGIMGGLSLLFLIVILARTAFAKPPVVASEAEEYYRQGLKLYLAKDYEGAKVNFSEAVTLAPDSAEAKRYQTACDVEVHARGAMQNAERAIGSRRYAEAVKALDAVDSASQLHDDAVRRRKEMAPKAAAEDVDEARQLQQEDPNTARARVQQALALDPGNADARALAKKMNVELPPPPANTVVATPLAEARPAAKTPEPEPPPPPKPVVQKEPKPVAQKEPKPVAQKEPPPPREPKKPQKPSAKDDEELAPVKVTKKDAATPTSKVDVPSSAQAAAAYKARDFAGAERMYRMEARNQTGKTMEKTIAFANQVRELKALLDKAAADEGKNASAAVKDYEDATALDGRLGRGQHAAYFKQRIGKLQLPLAQQAFAQGKYEAAFAAVTQAQKAGAGDGGLLKQLENKAKELNDKGAAMQKSNLPQAKQYWRQVIKMVPSSSQQYARAYQLINSTGGGRKDEDED